MKPKTMMSGEALNATKVGKNEWLLNITCCDCELVHFFIFTKNKNKLSVMAYRDDYLTMKFRKKKGIKIKEKIK